MENVFLMLLKFILVIHQLSSGLWVELIFCDYMLFHLSADLLIWIKSMACFLFKWLNFWYYSSTFPFFPVQNILVWVPYFYWVLVQISKLSMIPVVCVLEWILHNKQYTREVKMSVMVVVIGVGVCTVTDVKVNAKGFICACVAVLSTSLQQIVSNFISQCFSIST